MTGTFESALEVGLAERAQRVQDRIAEAAQRVGRDPAEITLVAVCKTVDRQMVDTAYEVGLRDFGENRVQDALKKFADDVPDDLVLHMIGSLQTNKVRQVVGKFALIHSVDRPSLIDEIEKRAAIADLVQPVLIEVNVGREEQKHGCAVEETPEILEYALSKPHLDVRGFMTMAPFHLKTEATRPAFVEMREIAENMRAQFPGAELDTLSMGMTNDFEVAIEEGSTMVRVGRAIFHAEHAI